MKRTGILVGLMLVGFVVAPRRHLATAGIHPGGTMRTAPSRRFRAASARKRSGRRTGAGATVAPTVLGAWLAALKKILKVAA
jgi:hypothetical protein